MPTKSDTSGEASRRTALIVLGMHRSGTSPLTRVLSLLGADLPSVLMPPAPGDNELGFWEPDEIVKIHDRLLADAGSSWDDVLRFPDDWYASDAAARFRSEILRILERDFSRSTLFVLKDPRICRLLPFWLTILRELDAAPRFVIAIRNPLEVAASLGKRNDFSLAKSVLLWLWHLLEAERETRGQMRSIVPYEGLLRDWRSVAKRVSSDLGISWPRESAEAAAQIDAFLSGEQRHHAHSLEDLSEAPIADWIKQVYRTVLENIDVPSRLASSLDDVRRELVTADAAYGPLIAEASRQLSTEHQAVERLTHELEMRDGASSEKEPVRLLQELKVSVQEIATKDDHIVALAGELATSVRDLADVDERVVKLTRELAARERKLVKQDDQIVRLAGELKERDAKVVEKDQRILSLMDVLRMRDEELADKEEDLASVSVTLSERNRELGQKNEQFLRLSTQLQATANQLKWMERVIQGVLASRSWRVTKPMRDVAVFLRGLKRKIAIPRSDEREVTELPPPVQPERGPASLAGNTYLPSNNRRRFALYIASRGNYFFGEIRDLLAAGLRSLDFDVVLRTELDGFPEDADWHLIIAPHEFFYLGAGAALRERPTPRNLILFNTEQPTTKWFELAAACFHKSCCVWDIDRDCARSIEEKGVPAHHVPLGYVGESNPFPEVEELPDNYHTCFLEPEVRRGSYLNVPLERRPIDVLFLGTVTPRRDAFFASATPILAKHRCYLSLPDASRPKIVRVGSTMDTMTAIGLAQRSKIVLNVHREGGDYFEWHRIVMHGIWHKALVLSEPASGAPPLRAGSDFVEAPLGELAGKIDYYLSDPIGRREAQIIASQGFQTLSTKCRLKDVLRPLIRELYAPDTPVDPWQAVPAGGETSREWSSASAPAFPE